MMKHNKIWLCLLLLVMTAALCLAGCGGDQTGTIEPGTTVTDPTGDPNVTDPTGDPGNVTDPTGDPNATDPTGNPSDVTDPTGDPSDATDPTDPPTPTTPPTTDPPTPTTPPTTDPPTPTTPPVTDPPAPAVGTQENPAALVIGSNTIPGGSNYYLTWTANKDCTLNLQFPDDGWTYQVNNLTSGEQGAVRKHTDEMVYNPAQISVYKGDVLQIMIKGSKKLTVTASQGSMMGTSSDPLRVTEGVNTIRVPAGKTVYASGRIYGMTMTVSGAANTKVLFNKKGYEPVNGVITIAMPTTKPGNATPLVFSITNNTGADKVYTVTCKVPTGTFSNPEKLVLGSNTATVQAGSADGYVYTWTATGNGTLTIDMPNGQGWYYVINNLTTNKYGDPHTSDESPVVDPGTLTVKKGDEIQIIVSTYDPNNTNTTPAGEVTFTASFA